MHHFQRKMQLGHLCTLRPPSHQLLQQWMRSRIGCTSLGQWGVWVGVEAFEYLHRFSILLSHPVFLQQSQWTVDVFCTHVSLWQKLTWIEIGTEKFVQSGHPESKSSKRQINAIFELYHPSYSSIGPWYTPQVPPCFWHVFKVWKWFK